MKLEVREDRAVAAMEQSRSDLWRSMMADNFSDYDAWQRYSMGMLSQYALYQDKPKGLRRVTLYLAEQLGFRQK